LTCFVFPECKFNSLQFNLRLSRAQILNDPNKIMSWLYHTPWEIFVQFNFIVITGVCYVATLKR